MNITLLIPPLVGAIIGYATNEIAIKMLFRPLKPIKVLGHTLPFTPGIIPRNRERIAQSIGRMVAQRLITKESLMSTLLSDETTERIRQMVKGYVDKQKQNTKPLSDALSEVLGKKEVEDIIDNLSCNIAAMATEKLQKSPMMLLGLSLGSLLGVDVTSEIRRVVTDLCKTPVAELAAKTDGKTDTIADGIVKIYRNVVTDKLPEALASIDISKMVEKRINEMDLLEVENMILDVIHRELRAVVWFGALLGLLLGLMQSIFGNYI